MAVGVKDMNEEVSALRELNESDHSDKEYNQNNEILNS